MNAYLEQKKGGGGGASESVSMSADGWRQAKWWSGTFKKQKWWKK